MKTKFILFYIVLFLCSSLAIAQKDSITIGKKKQFFIGVNAGLGLGWRINENIPDSAVGARINSKGENPGLAYTFSLNAGFTHKRFRLSLGIEYNFSGYHNNSYRFYGNRNYPYLPFDTVYVTVKYKYYHKIISLPLRFNFLLGKNQNCYAGVILYPSWLLDYEMNKYDLIKSNPIFMAGVSLGAKVIELTKIDVFINCQFYYSSIIGKDVFVSDVYYQSKPHRLIVPSLGINLNYKL